MIAFIGGGNMAEALIRGMVQSGMRDIVVSEPREQRRSHLEAAYGIRITADNLDAVSSADIIILAVKPQNMDEVLGEIAGSIGEDKTVVSIAAGITISYLQGRLKTARLVRVMPNVASMVQEGMAVISLCECMDEKVTAVIRDIFMASGRVLTLPEKYMDAVTAVSGSGPAFIARFVELMVEGGVKLGLREDDALELALQTLAGTSRLIEGGLQPSRLIEMVKSPGGTTAEGLKALEESGLGEAVLGALEAAARRSRELAR
jgi:pyrroline-5-carboxylate reductase